jgi:hypothetical protein
MRWQFSTAEAPQRGWSHCAGRGCAGQTPTADEAGRVRVQASAHSNPARGDNPGWLRARGVTPWKDRKMRRPRTEQPARIDGRMQSADQLFAASSEEGHLT